MKKKLLIMLAVVSMLVCIFAISVSAKTVTTIDGKEVTVTTYDDAPAKTNITVSTDDVVVFDDGFCCPSAYVFKDNKTKMWDGNGNGAINDALDFSFVNGKREKTYTLANITEFDADMVSNMNCLVDLDDFSFALHDSSLLQIAPLSVIHKSEQCSASISIAFSRAAMEGLPKWAFQIPSWAR